jgi:hypothetical protein
LSYAQPELLPPLDGAEFDGPYRRHLWLPTDRGAGLNGVAAFVMLNPSKAGRRLDNGVMILDATVRKIREFARRFGCSGAAVINLYDWISTDPAALRSVAVPCSPLNDQRILEVCTAARIRVLAWGAEPMAAARAPTVLELLRGFDLHCLGRTKDGHPRHPCRLAYSTPLELFRSAA